MGPNGVYRPPSSRGIGDDGTITIQPQSSYTPFYVPPINVIDASQIDLGTPPTVTTANPSGVVNPTVTAGGTSIFPATVPNIIPSGVTGGSSTWLWIVGGGAALLFFMMAMKR